MKRSLILMTLLVISLADDLPGPGPEHRPQTACAGACCGGTR